MNIHSLRFPVESLHEWVLPDFFGSAFIAVESAVTAAMQSGAQGRDSGHVNITGLLQSFSSLSDCWMRLIEKTLECALDEVVGSPDGQSMEGHVSLRDAFAVIHKFSIHCNSLLNTAVSHAYDFGANSSEDAYRSMAQAREAVIQELNNFRSLAYRSQY